MSILRCVGNTNPSPYVVPENAIKQLFKSLNRIKKPAVLEPILKKIEDSLINAGTTVDMAVADLAVTSNPEWVTRLKNVAFFGMHNSVLTSWDALVCIGKNFGGIQPKVYLQKNDVSLVMPIYVQLQMLKRQNENKNISCSTYISFAAGALNFLETNDDPNAEGQKPNAKEDFLYYINEALTVGDRATQRQLKEQKELFLLKYPIDQRYSSQAQVSIRTIKYIQFITRFILFKC